MIKKITVILLVVLLVVCFVACDKENDIDDTSSIDNSKQSSTVSVYEEDDALTSSELEELESQFKDSVSVVLTPSQDETANESSSSETTSSDTSLESSAVTNSSETDNTSSTTSEPVWIGPF